MEREVEKESSLARKAFSIAKVVSVGAISCAASFTAFYYGQDSRQDWLGDLHRRRTDAEVEEEVLEAKRELYDRADAAEKYALTFLAARGLSKSVKVGSLEGGKGIAGKVDTIIRGGSLAEMTHPVGDNCLNGTPYDTEQPAWSQLLEPGARPAQLQEYEEFGGVIAVKPWDKSLPPIYLKYDPGVASLVPVDEATASVLAHYETVCKQD